MKSIITLMAILFATQGSASSLQCVDRETAEKSLTMFIANDDASIYNMPTDEYFYNYVADDLNTPVDFITWLADFQNQAVLALTWNSNNNQYETVALWSFECAPSASCWGGYNVDCDGGTTSWFEGEE